MTHLTSPESTNPQGTNPQSTNCISPAQANPNAVWAWLQSAAQRHGLQCLGVSDTHLAACAPGLAAWLEAGMHGSMDYMQRHGQKRLEAGTILPGSLRIVSVRVPYWPEPAGTQTRTLQQELDTVLEAKAPYISLYARGRDYHKTIRRRLQKLMDEVHGEWGPMGYRITCDSAPTPEVEIARKAGLGWRGKHTLLIHPQAGSLFFLAEIFTNLPLPLSGEFAQEHCGSCSQCISACPTQAIVEPYKVDARLCISYLTIEHPGPIPLALRPLMGTRLYGCDDCQLVCPWNKFAQASTWADFNTRPQFNSPSWASLMAWDEAAFLRNTEGSAIRRIGFERWQRNLAVAAGNALRSAKQRVKEAQGPTQTGPKRPNPSDLALLEALGLALNKLRSNSTSAMVQEHVDWALAQA